MPPAELPDSSEGTYYFNGTLDDVRVYARALTQGEVQQLYNLGTANAAHSPSGPAAPLSQGLVGYWTFDGSATNWRTNTTADLSGQGNTGTLVNMSTTTSPMAGKIGQSLNFNESAGTYITLPSIASSNQTISAWVYHRSDAIGVDPDNGHTILQKGVQVNNGEFDIHIEGGGYNATAHVTTSASGEVQCFGIGSSAVIDLNKWYMITASKDGSNIRLYVNGKLNLTCPYSGTDTNSENWFIGTNANDGPRPYFFDGKIDDVRIYNRVLSNGEIKQLYALGTANAAHSNVWISDGLVGYWTFDGSATNWRTNTTADLSGNGNTGNLSTLSTTTTPVAGKIGQAFFVNGLSNWVRVEDSASLDVGDVVSYSMWLKRGRSGVQEEVFSKSQNTAVGLFEPGNTFQFHKHSGGLIIATTGTISDTKFHHIVVTKNGARARIYIDGSVAASTDSSVQTLASNDKPLCIGSSSGVYVCGTPSFQGVIDDFRVYSRELSATEVKQLYSAGK